ncbi:MAG: hypothetical protein J5630_08000 [Bacteroidaceae bacterium]|nr:hypothetical protein [Bacteroidaceae bacterium]
MEKTKIFNSNELLFSVFPKGHRNSKGEAVLAVSPKESRDIRWAYDYIISDRARWSTEALRSMMPTATKDELSDFKKLEFETATFNGIFSYRNARSLVAPSPFAVLDIDDLSSTEEARRVQQLLCNDPSVETALCFVSPKGLGVKWIVRIPDWAKSIDFKATFLKLRKYLNFRYGITVDKSGSDICRACFLPFDEKCYINSLYF